MGYMHINNLYKDQSILLFKECYALEKIHGTSAHISFSIDVEGEVHLKFFSGGESHEKFVMLFNQQLLLDRHADLGLIELIIFGEAYGGKQQGMSDTYGKFLKFIAFDVQIGESWLAVPQAYEIVNNLGLEFVHYEKVPTDIEVLDKLACAPSVQAVRNGIIEPKLREGIVLRPLIELKKNNGERIIAKHKNEAFKEREHPPKITDVNKLEVLKDAERIATEWVTEMRLNHIVSRMNGPSIHNTKEVILAMVEDVEREAKGEILESKEVRRAVSARAANLFKERLKGVLHA